MDFVRLCIHVYVFRVFLSCLCIHVSSEAWLQITREYDAQRTGFVCTNLCSMYNLGGGVGGLFRSSVSCRSVNGLYYLKFNFDLVAPKWTKP